ncbi:MAG: PAS domain-containing protein, partial [Candidatus Hermodarchaeota archaeon]
MLRESEKRFKHLFENLGDAVYVTKIGGINNGQILEVNPAAIKQTGYSRDELLKMSIIKDLYVKGSREILIHDRNDKLNKEILVKNVEKKRKKDGSEFWTEVIVTPMEFKGEKASLSIDHDISNRIYIEKALRESEERFRSLYENT